MKLAAAKAKQKPYALVVIRACLPCGKSCRIVFVVGQLMQKPKLGPAPTPAEVASARQASIDAFAEADRKHRAWLAVLARLQFYIEQDKQLILKENMREPRGRD